MSLSRASGRRSFVASPEVHGEEALDGIGRETAACVEAARVRPPTPPGWVHRVSLVMDGALECGVLSFAIWTVLYHLALVAPLPAGWVFGVWVCLSGFVVLARLWRRDRYGVVRQSGHPGPAIVVAALFAAASSVVVRPDLDDASYTVRSTWVAANGGLRAGDVIFSGGRWPGLPEQTPYLPSVESLFGWLARTSGISAGDVVYSAYVPIASFGAVWALWTLLREWRVRRPTLALALSSVFLLWGGSMHASWGNLHFARIWQGKVTLVAILVPLVYAWCARYWASSTNTGRRVALGLLGAAGIVGTGLSSTGIFVVPGVMVIASCVGLVTRRVRAALVLFLVGAGYPLVVGAVVKVIGKTSQAIPGSAEDPWVRTLGSGSQAWVAAVAAALALAAVAAPTIVRLTGVEGRITAAAAVVAGALVAVPTLFAPAISLMGTDAVAWRLVWIVPVPAIVGLLACLPGGRGRIPAAVIPVVAGVALVLGGSPIWSAANGAALERPGSWKVNAVDLATARWIVGQRAPGLYLAREQVVAAVGTLSAELRPVGSRGGYMAPYGGVPDAQIASRTTLQRWVDGLAAPAELEGVPAALDQLGVTLVCLPASRFGPLDRSWTAAFRDVGDVCWRR